jgi:transcriptional regulator with XRE-family HTH domain
MKSIAELVNDLFRTHRKPDGREYTSSDVSRALNGELDPTYIAKLRRGGIPNPGRNTLLLLCRFFGVAPSYFFPELDGPQPSDPISEAQEDPLRIGLRTTNLDPDVQMKLEQLIRAMQKQKE